MLSKVVALCLLCAFSIVLVIAKPIPPITPGTYKITNERQPKLTLRAYTKGQPIYAAPGGGIPQDFKITPADQGGYTIENPYVKGFVSVKNAVGELVKTGDAKKTFFISPAGGGTYVIKVPNQDLVWDLFDQQGAAGDPVGLRGANGDASQRWTLRKA
jgi:hypothetical protein